ncbi:MAG: sigma-70 family RNA polymerase sigma factor [Deltaproteobacteria bacterium]|nr:sigma-70 family RNA polymerase sigma factor [Deltaproteobacteria bacterium]
MTDEELIEQVINGLPGAQAEFVLRYEGLVLGLARGRFGFEAEAAREIFQRVAEKLWDNDCRALKSWRRNGRFSSYLTVIVCHLCLRERKKDQMRDRILTETPRASPQWVADGPSASELLDHQEKQGAIREAWGDLSARDRLLLALRFQDDRSPKEISSALGLRPGTARKALHDAVARLKQRVKGSKPELFDTELSDPLGPSRETPHKSKVGHG